MPQLDQKLGQPPPLEESNAGKVSYTKLTKSEVRPVAEAMASRLREHGFDVNVDHSGSRAGLSSYLNLSHKETGRFVKDPIRVSDHGKGAFHNQFAYHVNSHEDIPKIEGKVKPLLGEMIKAGPSEGLSLSKEQDEKINRLRANNERRKQQKTGVVNDNSGSGQ